ncbi:cell division cycle protein 20 homolog [Ruditapes philippinarum]|uniref:cell division cycle protein 20 homolog n=1 Tax=Ruditapes philippinarum TaxID=129788 RepID=UPI00295B15B1|nr:cell division cycle protein 20 homolog [Ruditapes philippinarum]
MIRLKKGVKDYLKLLYTNMAERKYTRFHRTAFDRFIPFRPNLDVETSHARLMLRLPDCAENELGQFKSPVTKSYARLLSETTHVEDGNVLPICSKPFASPFKKRLTQLFPTRPDEGYSSPTTDKIRSIPTSPDCIMDMPGLRDDFYTNLLDWSNKNLIAVALFQSAYVWDAESKDCQRIEIHFPQSYYYISALAWSPRDKALAISDNDGEITICDVEKLQSQRKFVPLRQKCSVGALKWTNYGIISGNRRGEIRIHDDRCKDSSALKCMDGHHRKDVCGLSVSPGTSYLASGGDDGHVNIWDLRMMTNCKTIKAHSACVKALSWCPWRQNVIATGGGLNDGNIRLWYAHTGEQLAETATNLQVCGLLWSEEYNELVSALSSQTPDRNDLVVWNMKKFEFEAVAKLRQHMARPLHIALSPDETTIASAGADEALCLWNTFPKRSRRKQWSPWDKSPLNMYNYIR